MSDEPTERDMEALIRRGPFEWGAGDDDSWATLWPTSERDDPLRVILLGLDEDIEQACAVLNGYAERIAQAWDEGWRIGASNHDMRNPYRAATLRGDA